jgi:hypothetical protein
MHVGRCMLRGKHGMPHAAWCDLHAARCMMYTRALFHSTRDFESLGGFSTNVSISVFICELAPVVSMLLLIHCTGARTDCAVWTRPLSTYC